MTRATAAGTAAARIATLTVVAAVLLAACRAGTGARPTVASSASPAPTSVSASPSPIPPLGTRVWLGGLRVASDPRKLNADTQLLLTRVDGATVVTPASCFEGLPAGLTPSDYIMGVVAGTKDELDQLVATSGFEVLFEVRVRVLCVD